MGLLQISIKSEKVVRKKIYDSQGQSLLELIVAMALFIILVATLVELSLLPMGIHLRFREYLESEALSTEAIEAIYSIRNRAWNEIIFSQSAIHNQAWQYDLVGEGSSEQVGKYSRNIEFFPLYRDKNDTIVASGTEDAYRDIFSQKIKVSINWQSELQKEVSLERNVIISAWDMTVWEQTDWSNGSGQELWQEDDKFFSTDANMVFNIDGQLGLKEIATSTLASTSTLFSSAFNSGQISNFSALSWTELIPEACSTCKIKVAIKTAIDNSGTPGEWSSTWCGPEGEDGDEEDYFLLNTGGLINMDHNGKQWIKYKIELIGDGNYSPIIYDIKIFYQQ